MDSTTAIDVTNMTDPQLVEYARTIWDEWGGTLPAQSKEPLEPVFHEVVARFERFASDKTPT